MKKTSLIVFHSLISLFAIGQSTAAVNPTPFETKLTASDAESNGEFGFSVAISGSTLIVGTDGYGPAYLFDATTGVELRKLSSDEADSNDDFFESVGISGNYAIVGPYLFDVATGSPITRLTADDATNDDDYGRVSAISGNRAVVGAHYINSAYLFDTTSGLQVAKLHAPDDEFFGRYVAIDDETVIVGAYRADVVNPQNGSRESQAGSAYVFSATTGEQLAKLIASDYDSGDNFGWSVDIDGDTAIVGAPNYDTGSGAAYLFDVATGSQISKLTPSDAPLTDEFGFSVAISGNIAMVGTPRDSEGGFIAGAVYLFDVETGTELAKLTASDRAGGANFGWAVAMSGETALVGARRDSGAGGRAGAAYMYSVSAFIPEPSSLHLGFMAVVGMLLRRRKRNPTLSL